MYCIKCGKLKEECICNNNGNNNNNNGNNKMAIIIASVIGIIILLVGFIFLGIYAFGNQAVSGKPQSLEKPEHSIKDDMFVSVDDHDTYFILHSDNTFTGRRNYCAGYHDIEGTYEINGRTLKLEYNESMGDGRNIEDYFYKESEIDYSYSTGDYYIVGCSGYDFQLVK